jgi:O-glycosyl hydrolase
MPSPLFLPRRRFLLASAAILASLPLRALAQGVSVTPGSPISCVVSPEPMQVMQGFGAAGAWWPNDLIHFRPEVIRSVADMLFSPEGIELSVYRYNIGGGGVGVTNPVRAPETFLVSPGQYDWDRDPGGRVFLHMAAERSVPILIGFVNSAPPIWTTNSASCGGTLVPGSEAAFAQYLVDVSTHFRDVEHIDLSYLSPMNEPDYRFEGAGQEGMGVPAEQRPAIIQALGRELAERYPSCRVIADESSRTGEQFLHEVSTWLATPNTADYVAALAVHRYDYPNDLVLGLADALAEGYGKPLWSTEVCCFDSRTGAFGQQFDPTIKSALMMANLMWEGMTVAHDAAFHWWVACSSEMGGDPRVDPELASRANDVGWNDGLLYYDPNYATTGNQQIYATKRYFAMGNFSRYVRPGAVRHDVSGVPRELRILAFETAPDPGASKVPQQLPGAADQGWTVVVINNAPEGSEPIEVRLQLPRAESMRLVPDVAVETSAARDLEPAELPTMSARNMVTVAVCPQSITTYVVRTAM